MAKKFLFRSIFESFKAKFTKNEETIRAGLKYVEALPEIGPQYDTRTAQITLPEDASEVIIMYPGKTVEKYKEILSVWFAYKNADWYKFETTISMLDAFVSGWDEDQIVGNETFETLNYRMNDIQDLYMRYWRKMEHEEEEYLEILKTDECVDRAFLKLYGPTNKVSYNLILRKILGKYRLMKKFAEANLRRDEKYSDRLRSMCITLSKSMSAMSIGDDDDDAFDRYRYEANRLLFYINWFNNLLERDINFNIIVAKCSTLTIPVKVYPKRGKWVT